MSPIVNPGYEADMLTRAANACRNAQKQMTGNTDWFAWVAPHLNAVAIRLREEQELRPAPDDSDIEEGSEFDGPNPV